MLGNLMLLHVVWLFLEVAVVEVQMKNRVICCVQLEESLILWLSFERYGDVFIVMVLHIIKVNQTLDHVRVLTLW